MILRFRKVTRYFLFLSDLLLINGSVGLGRFLSSAGIEDDAFLRYALLMNLLWILLVVIRDRYQPVTFVNVSKAAFRLLFTHFLLLVSVIYLFDRQEIPRSFIVLHYITLALLVLGSRYLYIFVYRRFSLFRYDKRRVVIIGNGDMSYKAASYLARPDSGYEFVGVFNDVTDSAQRLPILGKKSECIDYCVRHNVKEIFSTLMPESGEDFRDLINRAEQECIRVKFLPDFKMIFARDVNLSIDNDLLMIRFRDEQLEKFENRIIKRAFDLSLTLLLFITVLWWLIPLLSLLVVITSGFPVFFIQKRSGRDGRVFNCYKFRTMHLNPHADEKAVEPEDPRLTKFGAFLRRTSLDELPQFLNVLRGDMSIVGPRPHMLKHTREYSTIINRYMVRHFLKPGITGWAQTNGFRGDITGNRMEERVKKDIWYIENWSFLLDIQIILKTIRLMLSGDKHAY
ncbi:MAG: exopolysaccharide biosynthesis polyprenyl glycosylphosphotransferase [Chitinophagaceae bacterium]|jgi:putative colanic acid biosynthesis UDP-glucose lipid carrier transferase|nr:exopolysaccharide biosynthesis polyprenyl glycosylphosphotransferase [Chitinophagaceae bacterium]